MEHCLPDTVFNGGSFGLKNKRGKGKKMGLEVEETKMRVTTTECREVGSGK